MPRTGATSVARTLRRGLIVTGVIVTFLVLAGATYQGVATALERRQFPRPGVLVSVGGHQLHIYCTGRGSPTVVLEAPATGMSAAWAGVQTALAGSHRVCSYDRAGLGWSEASDRPFDPRHVPVQLHALLGKAGEQPPFVLAGQGLGGAFARLFAAQFASETAALVVIDPPKPVGQQSASGDEVVRLVNVAPWLARAGVLRATALLSRRAAGLPPAAAGPMRAFLNRPDHLTHAAAELSQWDAAVERAATGRSAHLRVVETTIQGSDPAALLTGPDASARAAAAISRAIAEARSAAR